jgi:Tfp pilus assembly protein FimV
MFEATDKAHNGKVQKLSRIAKSWKQKNDIPIRSYHLEVMAYNHVRTTSNDTPIDELTETFFDHLPNDVRRSTHDPAVSEERLDTYMDSKSKREASKKAKEAREKVDEARKHKENGEPEKAKEKLKEVYGEEFE